MLRYMRNALTVALVSTVSAAHAGPLPLLPEAGAEIVLARGGHGGGFHGRPGGGYHGGYHGGHHGGYHGGYRGGYRRPVVVTGGGWRRPGYGWRPGGAIAAGAAIGVLTAATAAAYASTAAPAAGLCWYYTDASYTAGFWDNCP